MRSYIVKLLPTKENPVKGEFMFNELRFGQNVKCLEINYKEGILLASNEDWLWQNIQHWRRAVYFLCSNEMNEGDEIVVEYTDGYKPTGSFEIGVLTRKWNDGPYCAIDGKEIDLAGEGHSSNVYKKICEIDFINSKWVKDGDEFEESSIKLESFWEDKRAKYFEEGDNVETNIEEIFSTSGVIKSIIPVYPGSWNWEDKIILTKVKRRTGFLPETFEELPDMEVLRSRLKSVSVIATSCQIQCPTCKQLH